ncbi:MAG: peptide-methionine (S)-S-oxide reductase MsrA [Chitinophagaceae bacterium]|nr:peptide-methionine (S)-S-oxide reductase MsrA [Chitinophagaceae bacterium]
MLKVLFISVISFAGLSSCAQKDNSNKKNNKMNASTSLSNIPGSTPLTLDTATFGTGCFWCTEAIFQQLEGVEKVTSGYSGGTVANPTYEEVCSKTTGHAECLNILYNPKKISFDELLEIFWQTHDPTTLNRQGADVGPQYRSVIFYHNEEQKAKAAKYRSELDKSGAFNNPIVTTLEPFTVFYPAEAYHQNYYRNNTSEGYCQFVIRPKVEKFEKVFRNKLKKQ